MGRWSSCRHIIHTDRESQPHLPHRPSVKPERLRLPFHPPHLTQERLSWPTLPGNTQGSEFWGMWFRPAKSPH